MLVRSLLAQLVIGIGAAFLTQASLPQATSAQVKPGLRTVVLFGATGTIGDGVLQAAMNDPGIGKVIVVVRRSSPRIDAGVASGKVEKVIHKDFLDYAPLRELIANVDTVYWALGTASTNVSHEEYGVIHVDYPVRFLSIWREAAGERPITFHYVSGKDTDKNSTLFWAREKARAEVTLFGAAKGTHTRVISYRPPFIMPPEGKRKITDLLKRVYYGLFSEVMDPPTVGHAMLQVSLGEGDLPNGTILETKDIERLAEKYRAARAQTVVR